MERLTIDTVNKTARRIERLVIKEKSQPYKVVRTGPTGTVLEYDGVYRGTLRECLAYLHGVACALADEAQALAQLAGIQWEKLDNAYLVTLPNGESFEATSLAGVIRMLHGEISTLRSLLRGVIKEGSK